jgi:hypothetical protein
MTTADLNDAKLISEEISIIKDKLNKLQNKKEIKHEDITDDDEYEWKTDNGTDDEQEEEPKNEIIEPKREEEPKQEQEEEEEEDKEEEEEEPSEDEEDEDYERENDIKEIKKMLNDEENIKSFEKEYKRKNKSIDLTKYVKKEVKQYLNAFDVNITRLIKKYKHVDDITEEELFKIQQKYNNENKYFNKKSKKLLNKLSEYDDLSGEEYKALNKRIKKIRNRFTDFVSEFVDLENSE